MTKDDIIHLPNPKLRQRSTKIGHVDASIRQLAENMIAATLDWEQSRPHELGAALAAIQVAQAYRLIIIRQDFENRANTSFMVFINAEIVKREGEPTHDMEGCLSVPDIYGKIERYPKVKVKALNLDGKEVRLTAHGFLARVFQHEIDHTKGLLFIDHIKSPNDLFQLQDSGKFTPVEAVRDDS
ncbi:MAG TPA: peptide deformylase [Candidatus Saccharimonadales bacterium]|nr:peptide deformylase [Candidatus Saccharimonadales bacterium]